MLSGSGAMTALSCFFSLCEIEIDIVDLSRLRLIPGAGASRLVCPMEAIPRTSGDSQC